MKLLPIGATETYDPSCDYSWLMNLKPANIIITKNLTDLLIQALLIKYVKERCILHITVTGMGGSKIEPNVPDMYTTAAQVRKLISLGFPVNQIVLRISPIIPTDRGIQTVLSVFEAFSDLNILRIRFSTINLYKHVLKRFDHSHIDLPWRYYGTPSSKSHNLIKALTAYFNIPMFDWGLFMSDYCMEIDLKEGKLLYRSCVSQTDINILDLVDKYTLNGKGKQRSICMCPDNKTQIIRRKPQRCKLQCLYCYEPD